MRLWSLHPSLLDAKGLVACWRETLLAQKALAGQTKGYTEHPQLLRFKAQPAPLVHLGGYLQGLLDEADARGYRFDAAKILHPAAPAQLLRFKAQPAPLVHLGGYLQGLLDEADARGYRFDAAKILHPAAPAQLQKIPVTGGQVRFEREHLLRKLTVRDPARIVRLEPAGQLALHPLFVQVPGPVESWEKDPLAAS